MATINDLVLINVFQAIEFPTSYMRTGGSGIDVPASTRATLLGVFERDGPASRVQANVAPRTQHGPVQGSNQQAQTAATGTGTGTTTQARVPKTQGVATGTQSVAGGTQGHGQSVASFQAVAGTHTQAVLLLATAATSQLVGTQPVASTSTNAIPSTSAHPVASTSRANFPSPFRVEPVAGLNNASSLQPAPWRKRPRDVSESESEEGDDANPGSGPEEWSGRGLGGLRDRTNKKSLSPHPLGDDSDDDNEFNGGTGGHAPQWPPHAYYRNSTGLPPVKRARYRPSKNPVLQAPPPVVAGPKRRGRKPKAKTVPKAMPQAVPSTSTAGPVASTSTSAPVSTKPVGPVEVQVVPKPKKRGPGRPRKIQPKTTAPASASTLSALDPVNVQVVPETPKKRGRGRPPKLRVALKVKCEPVTAEGVGTAPQSGPIRRSGRATSRPHWLDD